MLNLDRKIYKIKDRLKSMGVLETLRYSFFVLIRPIVPLWMKFRWKILTLNKNYSGVTNFKYKNEIIVSLTSYAKRIDKIDSTIKTLLTQKLKPNKIILWLAKEEFPNKENDLPESLLKLKKYGLTIDWYHDVKSYKKMIPTLNKYPEAIIITADDDLIYLPKTTKKLYEEFLKNPNTIYCHRTTPIIYKNGNICIEKVFDVPRDYYFHKKANFLNIISSGAGTLFPPHCFYKDVCNEELFMKLSPKGDDLWWWAMTTLKGTDRQKVKLYNTILIPTENDSINPLSKNNVTEDYNVVQINKIVNHYPELRKIVEENLKNI